jgi:hypothetical protein
MQDVVHGFRSERSVMTYCGEVSRPDPEKPRTMGPIPEGMVVCEDCLLAYYGYAALAAETGDWQ